MFWTSLVPRDEFPECSVNIGNFDVNLYTRTSVQLKEAYFVSYILITPT